MRRNLALIARAAVAAAAVAALAGGCTAPAPAPDPERTTLPYWDATLPVPDRVADLLARMDLADKVGQMTQAERSVVSPREVTPSGKLPVAWGAFGVGNGPEYE